MGELDGQPDRGGVVRARCGVGGGGGEHVVRLKVYVCSLAQDTAGSERYEAMSRIYYRGARAAVVCYGKALFFFQTQLLV